MCIFTVLGGGGGGGGDQYLVWPPFASRSATHLLIELIRLLIVACWSTPLQWLCEVEGYWQELEHTVVYADPEHPKHAQWVTCPVTAGHARTGMFSASRNCVQILATWGHALACCKMRWRSWMNGTTMGLRISSRYLCAFKMPSIKCTCVHCSLWRRLMVEKWRVNSRATALVDIPAVKSCCKGEVLTNID